MIDRCAAPHVKPYLVTAALIGLLDAQSIVANGECAVLPYSPTLVRVWGLDKPTHVSPRSRHRPGTPQWCGARRHRQVTIGESFFDDTDIVGIGDASPRQRR